jgi:plasmid stabilization system protein ParE
LAKIRWSDESLVWLEDIYRYIAQDKPMAAGRVIKGIYEKAHLLELYPDLGYQYRRVEEGNIRILLYGHYRIAYLLRPDSEIIHILGIFHGSLDIERYLS